MVCVYLQSAASQAQCFRLTQMYENKSLQVFPMEGYGVQVSLNPSESFWLLFLGLDENLCTAGGRGCTRSARQACRRQNRSGHFPGLVQDLARQQALSARLLVYKPGAAYKEGGQKLLCMRLSAD